MALKCFMQKCIVLPGKTHNFILRRGTTSVDHLLLAVATIRPIQRGPLPIERYGYHYLPGDPCFKVDSQSSYPSSAHPQMGWSCLSIALFQTRGRGRGERFESQPKACPTSAGKMGLGSRSVSLREIVWGSEEGSFFL
jgi:hypothetical protein